MAYPSLVERMRAAQARTPPAQQTGLQPNLLTRPPEIGPEVWYTPAMRLPAQATVAVPVPKCVASGVRNAPKLFGRTDQFHMCEHN